MRLIEEKAFQGCKELKRVTFVGEALETIGNFAFLATGLESFTAPSSLRKIENNAFSFCWYLKDVDLDACVLTDEQDSEDFLSYDVFKGSVLESIRLPRGLRVI